MAGKPLFHYDEARGRMESVRWLLAAAGVEVSFEMVHPQMQLKQTVSTESLTSVRRCFLLHDL